MHQKIRKEKLYKTIALDLQIINCTRIEGKIRVRRTLGYVVEDFDR
jgi:hypothetical protein